MKLNLHILQDELQDVESYVFCNSGMELVFDRFEEYVGQDIYPDCLYLVDASKITADLMLRENLSLVSFGNVKNSLLQYRRCDLLMLPNERMSDRSSRFLSRVFSKYGRWSEDLLTLAMANDAIRQIFSSGLLEEIFGNPILMQTGNGLFGISCGTLPDDFDSERWKSIVENGREVVSAEGLDYDDLAVQESVREPFVFEKTEGYTLVATNAFFEGRFSGRLVHCDAGRSFTKGYLSLAAYFNRIFEGIVERNINDGIVGHGECNVFVELLGDWHTDSAWLDSQLAKIGWEKDAPGRLIVVSSGSRGSFSSLARLMNDNLRSLFPDAFVFSYKEDSLVVLKGALDEEGLRRKTEGILKAPDAVVAVSLPFFDVGKLRSVYKQCRFLIESEAMIDEGRIRFYSDEVFRHLAVSYGLNRDYKWLLHPRVCLLAAYDRERGSNLVECLQAIMECGFRKKDAASRLCVHQNTITYKIDRIREISGMDLDSVGKESRDDLFHILLSCKLLSEFSES